MNIYLGIYMTVLILNDRASYFLRTFFCLCNNLLFDNYIFMFTPQSLFNDMNIDFDDLLFYNTNQGAFVRPFNFRF